jgi:hypothetical protein
MDAGDLPESGAPPVVPFDGVIEPPALLVESTGEERCHEPRLYVTRVCRPRQKRERILVVEEVK